MENIEKKAAYKETRPLVVIVGETASGKTALAMELANKFNGEIVAADSWTVYEGFDIGTAKPTEEERHTVPHHLLDVADPLKGFSAAEYKRLAVQAIDDVHDRDKLPIMAGGTGLYVDSVIFDYGFLPVGSPGQRERLNQLSITELLGKISEAVISTDGIDIRNKRRLIRLLETDGQRPKKQKLRSNTLIIGIKTNKEELRNRIVIRVDRMFGAGLEQEVRRLSGRYGWDVEPMKGIGYKEFRAYFEGSQSIEQTKELIIKNTLNFAKRQRTWFKRNNSIQWVQNRGEAVEITTTFLNTLR